MAWYWWALIGVGVILLGWAKLTILNKWMTARKERNQPVEEEE